MKKTLSFALYCMLFATYTVYAQVPPDSLWGTYAGTVYVKDVSTSSWISSTYTLFVSGLDSAKCTIGVDLCRGQNMPFYTTYTYCTTPVKGNYYAKFYSMDSLTAIADSNTIQNPCVTAFSIRFYGKRISSNWGLGINEIKNRGSLIVYPNPANTILFVEYKMFKRPTPIKITDITGKEVRNIQMSNSKIRVDISGLENGIYFVNLKSEKGVPLISKISIHR